MARWGEVRGITPHNQKLPSSSGSSIQNFWAPQHQQLTDFSAQQCLAGSSKSALYLLHWGSTLSQQRTQKLSGFKGSVFLSTWLERNIGSFLFQLPLLRRWGSCETCSDFCRQVQSSTFLLPSPTPTSIHTCVASSSHSSSQAIQPSTPQYHLSEGLFFISFSVQPSCFISHQQVQTSSAWRLRVENSSGNKKYSQKWQERKAVKYFQNKILIM